MFRRLITGQYLCTGIPVSTLAASTDGEKKEYLRATMRTFLKFKLLAGSDFIRRDRTVPLFSLLLRFAAFSFVGLIKGIKGNNV
jgi:hypothetical protein